MAEQVTRGGKKNRKFSRNKRKCERYRAEGRREKNKAARLRRHMKAHKNDAVAKAALGRL
jgi:hypothetical protein